MQERIKNTLTGAIRAKKARKELLSLAIGSANRTAIKLSETDKTSKSLQNATVGSKLSKKGERLQQVPKNK